MKRTFLSFGCYFFLVSILQAQTLLIPTGSQWKYFDQGNHNEPMWRFPSFNDASWSTANAELGYGDGDEATVVSFGGNANNKHITTYFRKSFNLSQATILEGRVKVDDGVVVYLNGTEVYRNNLPAQVTHNTLALNAANE
ncbi:MAG: hypothetical protein MUE30_07235, partial [Spirosomaceae bacterium]|nr:hypothetical protein [Spirosomataceae bacterium]